MSKNKDTNAKGAKAGSQDVKDAKKKRPTFALGIDVGGTGIKGSTVDLVTGELLAARERIPTPENSTPEEVARVFGELQSRFDLPADVPIGVAFPGPLHHGIVKFIANLHPSWAGVNLETVAQEALGRPVFALNDADAAGYGEALFGAAKGLDGTVLVLTLGTGIGSALLVDGVLVPNTELGHLTLDGASAEKQASAVARERAELSYEDWAGGPLQRYLDMVEMLFSPDVIVIGGGVSKSHEKFLPLLKTDAVVLPATLRNNAGIVGAATWAASHSGLKAKKK